MGTSRLNDVLYSNGLNSQHLEQLYSWPPKRVERLTEALAQINHDRADVPVSEFSFVSNGRLSGAPAPCPGTECRVPRARELARFSALYADHVVIRNPFEQYTIHEGRSFANHESILKVIADIEVALTFDPLVEARIVSFSPKNQHWCPICIYEVDRRGELDRILRAEDAAAWQKRVSHMVERLRSEFQRKTKGYLFLKNGHPELELTGDLDLVPHGSIHHHAVNTAKAWLQGLKPGRRKLLSARQLWASRVLNDHISTIIEDIATQNHYATVSRTNYVTDRTIDLSLIDSISDRATRSINRNVLAAVAHGLPFINTRSIVDVLKVRRAEEEAFRVYRDAVASVLATARTGSEVEVRQAFADIVSPEINRIDLILRNARRSVLRGAGTEVALGLATVSIALFSGLLPPQWAEVFAAFGGASGAKAIATKALEAVRLPKEVQENRFFFLWKLKKMRA